MPADDVVGAMRTPDGAWRVEIVRRPGRGRWYRVVHGDDVLDWLSIAAVERILAESGVELHTLVDIPQDPPRVADGPARTPLTEVTDMTADRVTGSTRPLRRRKRAADDDGFSLIETLVSLAVIAVVMAGTAPFLIKSVTLVGQNRTQQVAVEVANNALERARALSPSSLFAGRGLTAMQNQLAAAPAQVKTLLTATQLDVTDLLSGVTDALSGATAPLPTAPLALKIGDVTYTQNWYLGKCWQPKADSKLLGNLLGDCLQLKPLSAGLTSVELFRVVVAVTWTHNGCADSKCVYVASTLVSPTADPIFDLKRPPPTIANPGAQATYINDSVSFQLVAAGGSLPRTWTLTGLPPGLTVNAAGLITGRPTTAGTYPVAANVKDRDGNSDDVTFSWTVAALPALTSPGAQVFRTTTAVSLPVPLTGGLAPFVWTATGLPAGLIIDPLTGVVSGIPLVVQTTAQTATVNVTAKGNKTASTTFTWRTLTPVRFVNPGSFSATKGDNGAYSLGPAVSGGQGPYTWRATGLPPGMTINTSTGATSGIITAGTRYLVTVEVTDSAGGTAAQTALVTVNHRTTTDLRVTTPSPATPDQSTAVNAAVSLTAAAAGQSGLSWSATNLPPGLAMSAGGVVTGRPTTAGTYTTTFTVTGGGQVANLMFLWRVTA